MQGGSAVKDGRWGGSPWLHKRGFGSAEAREGPGRPPEGILGGAGDSHPLEAFGYWMARTRRWMPSVVFGQQYGRERIVGLGDDPEAVLTLTIGGKQPASVVEGIVVCQRVLRA